MNQLAGRGSRTNWNCTYTMNSHTECEIKQEVDPLATTEIKTEPQELDFENEIKKEVEEYDNCVKIEPVDVDPSPYDDASVKAVLQVEDAQKCLDSLLQDNGKKLQFAHESTEEEEIKDLHLQEPCESSGNQFEEQTCNVGEETCTSSSYENNEVASEQTGKFFMCEFCNVAYSHEYYFMAHMRMHSVKKYAGEELFTCNTCNKSFSEETLLTEHIQAHKCEKPFMCKICGKTFYFAHHHSQHMQKHKGKKPFMCPICGKLFSSKYLLFSHFRIHTDEKSFKCDVCGKEFCYKRSLSDHIGIHMGEKASQT